MFPVLTKANCFDILLLHNHILAKTTFQRWRVSLMQSFSLLISSKFERINQLLFNVKFSENILLFSDVFRSNSYICRDYFKHFELLPFSHRRLSCWITFHLPRGARGEAPRKCLSFAPTEPLEIGFYGQEN